MSKPLFSAQSVGEGAATAPRLDAYGNIVGGVRSPAVDVPVATLTGEPNGPAFCILAGTTVKFSPATPARLDATHTEFVLRWAADVVRLTLEGYLTAPDAVNLVAAAQAAPVPSPGAVPPRREHKKRSPDGTRLPPNPIEGLWWSTRQVCGE
jgi:hypothetical protein